MKESNLFSSYLNISIVVSCFWVISIATIFINKTLLSDLSLDAPLFITWFQCVVSFSICLCLSWSGGIPRVFKFPKGSPWNIQSIKRVLPQTVLFTVMLTTNNLCLKYVGISFYYIGRSLTTVFNVIFSWVLLRESTSLRCLACCTFIFMGFSAGVFEENLLGSLSLKGTVYGVIGSLALSLYSIWTKKTLVYVNQEVWLLTYYNNAYAMFLFLPLMPSNNEIAVLWKYTNFKDTGFWIKMFVGGIAGFAIGYITSLQIQVTSPLTHTISGTAKAGAQTIIATQWNGETKSFLWWISNIIVLLSSAMYARFKQLEMVEKASQLLEVPVLNIGMNIASPDETKCSVKEIKDSPADMTAKRQIKDSPADNTAKR